MLLLFWGICFVLFSVYLSHTDSVRPVNKKSFLQHVEDLCANENAKFQEEFAVSDPPPPNMTFNPADVCL